MKSSLRALLTLQFIFLGCVSKTPHPDSFRQPATSGGAPEFELIRESEGGESWKGGSRQMEERLFVDDARAVMEASQQLSQDARGVTPRVFHEKSHGCLTGKIKIMSQSQELGNVLNKGLFAYPGAEYDLIGRFSNGVGASDHDARPDVRGLALKIFMNDSGGRPVDLLMTNSTNPFGRDQSQFVEFMKANMRGPLSLAKFINDQKQEDPRELSYRRHFLKSVIGIVDNPAAERYWSGHPYAFGPHTFMKFNVAPVGYIQPVDSSQEVSKLEKSLDQSKDYRTISDKLREFFQRRFLSANYLRARLQKKARAERIQYILYVQLFKDANVTPVENALVEWKELDSPSIPVAMVTFDRQEFDNPMRDRDCSELRFTPENFHPFHRPAGNMGRGRIFTYARSQALRHASEQPPHSSIVSSWRRGDYILR